MGRKPSDWFTISLCREHHAEQHTIGEASFEAGGRWEGCRIPLHFVEGRVLIPAHSGPIRVLALDDGSVALDGQTFRRATAGEP